MDTDTFDLNANDIDDLVEDLGLVKDIGLESDSSIDDDGCCETLLDTYGSEEWCEKQRELLDEDDRNLTRLDEMDADEFDTIQAPTFNTIFGIVGWLGVCDRMLERRHE